MFRKEIWETIDAKWDVYDHPANNFGIAVVVIVYMQLLHCGHLFSSYFRGYKLSTTSL